MIWHATRFCFAWGSFIVGFSNRIKMIVQKLWECSLMEMIWSWIRPMVGSILWWLTNWCVLFAWCFHTQGSQGMFQNSDQNRLSIRLGEWPAIAIAHSESCQPQSSVLVISCYLNIIKAIWMCFRISCWTTPSTTQLYPPTPSSKAPIVTDFQVAVGIHQQISWLQISAVFQLYQRFGLLMPFVSFVRLRGFRSKHHRLKNLRNTREFCGFDAVLSYSIQPVKTIKKHAWFKSRLWDVFHQLC